MGQGSCFVLYRTGQFFRQSRREQNRVRHFAIRETAQRRKELPRYHGFAGVINDLKLVDDPFAIGPN